MCTLSQHADSLLLSWSFCGKIYCQPSSGSRFRRKWGRERRISIWMSRFLGRRTTWRFKSKNGPSPGSIAAHSNVFEMIPGITRSAVTRVSHIKTRFEPIKNNASDHDTETPQIWQQRCCLTSLPPLRMFGIDGCSSFCWCSTRARGDSGWASPTFLKKICLSATHALL